MKRSNDITFELVSLFLIFCLIIFFNLIFKIYSRASTAENSLELIQSNQEISQINLVYLSKLTKYLESHKKTCDECNQKNTCEESKKMIKSINQDFEKELQRFYPK